MLKAHALSRAVSGNLRSPQLSNRGCPRCLAFGHLGNHEPQPATLSPPQPSGAPGLDFETGETTNPSPAVLKSITSGAPGLDFETGETTNPTPRSFEKHNGLGPSRGGKFFAGATPSIRA